MTITFLRATPRGFSVPRMMTLMEGSCSPPTMVLICHRSKPALSPTYSSTRVVICGACRKERICPVSDRSAAPVWATGPSAVQSGGRAGSGEAKSEATPLKKRRGAE